jgi:hypothetical protein
MERQQQVDQQLLERVVNNPAFRQELVNDPAKAIAEVTGQQPKQVMAERRQMLDKFLDKAANDPEFRRQLETDPQQAFEGAGFGEWYQVAHLTPTPPVCVLHSLIIVESLDF